MTAFMFAFMRALVYAHGCEHCQFVCTRGVHVFMCANMLTCSNTHMRACMRVCMYAYMDLFLYICMCIEINIYM